MPRFNNDNGDYGKRKEKDDNDNDDGDKDTDNNHTNTSNNWWQLKVMMPNRNSKNHNKKKIFTDDIKTTNKK